MANIDVKKPDDMAVTLTVGELKALVLEAVQSALHSSNGNAQADKLLGADEAAAMLGHSEIWLYRNSRRLPFSVKMGRSVRFSRKGIEKWIEGQKRA